MSFNRESKIKVKCIFSWRVIRYRRSWNGFNSFRAVVRFPSVPVSTSPGERNDTWKVGGFPSIVDALRQMRDVLALHLLACASATGCRAQIASLRRKSILTLLPTIERIRS